MGRRVATLTTSKMTSNDETRSGLIEVKCLKYARPYSAEVNALWANFLKVRVPEEEGLSLCYTIRSEAPNK